MRGRQTEGRTEGTVSVPLPLELQWFLIISWVLCMLSLAYIALHWCPAKIPPMLITTV